MRRSLYATLLTALLLGLWGAAGCAPAGEEELTAGEPAPPASPASPASDDELARLAESKRSLDQKRAELAARGQEAPPEREALAREVDQLAVDLSRRLVDYINAHPAVVGEPLDEHQLAAVRMKSEEDILTARQYIEGSGDYQRAIEIYEAALAIDPGNPRLEQELEKARATRYMTEERFAQLDVGMTEAEVRGLIGQPIPLNIREFADRGVTGWFYPKGPEGAAAAVWFRQAEGADGLVVYQLDFNAVEVKRPEQTAGQAAPAT